jgi:hypothetical protein
MLPVWRGLASALLPIANQRKTTTPLARAIGTARAFGTGVRHSFAVMDVTR